MRLIGVWITVGAVIALIFFEYLAVVPAVERFQEEINATDLNNTEAINTMNRHITMKDRMINAAPYLFVGAMILWGFMWSQQRETVTGAYY